MGRLDFEGFLDILVLQLYSLVDHFSLEGLREAFRQVLQFPLGLHFLMLPCVCISFPLLLVLYIYLLFIYAYALGSCPS